MLWYRFKNKIDYDWVIYLKKYIESIALMLQFMTRIPINKSLSCSEEDFKRGSIFMPIVGLTVGVFQFLIFYLFNIFAPSRITSMMIVLGGIFITGGFHMDGLGDTCDGFFAFKGGKEKIIEIMKDSRIGTYACIGIVVDILLKYACYAYIIEYKRFYGIILAPMLGRFFIEFLSLIGKRAKEKGSGNLFIGNVGKMQFLWSFIIIGLSFTAFYKYIGLWNLLLLLCILLIVALLFNSLCNEKIGGVTGDSLGAINEIAEMVCLIFIVCI